MGVTGKKEVRDLEMVAVATESAVVRNARRFQCKVYMKFEPQQTAHLHVTFTSLAEFYIPV